MWDHRKLQKVKYAPDISVLIFNLKLRKPPYSMCQFCNQDGVKSANYAREDSGL